MRITDISTLRHLERERFQQRLACHQKRKYPITSTEFSKTTCLEMIFLDTKKGYMTGKHSWIRDDSERNWPKLWRTLVHFHWNISDINILFVEIR